MSKYKKIALKKKGTRMVVSAANRKALRPILKAMYTAQPFPEIIKKIRKELGISLTKNQLYAYASLWNIERVVGQNNKPEARWTRPKVKILRAMWGTFPISEIKEALGMKEFSDAIFRDKAGRLRLKKSIKSDGAKLFSDKEIDALKMIYPLVPRAILSKFFFDRTESSIENAANKRNILKNRGWSAQDKDYLRKNYSTKRKEVLMSKLGRNWNQINQYANRMGLSRSKGLAQRLAKGWKPSEVKAFGQHYQNSSWFVIYYEIPNRNLYAIQTHAKKQGVKRLKPSRRSMPPRIKGLIEELRAQVMVGFATVKKFPVARRNMGDLFKNKKVDSEEVIIIRDKMWDELEGLIQEKVGHSVSVTDKLKNGEWKNAVEYLSGEVFLEVLNYFVSWPWEDVYQLIDYVVDHKDKIFADRLKLNGYRERTALEGVSKSTGDSFNLLDMIPDISTLPSARIESIPALIESLLTFNEIELLSRFGLSDTILNDEQLALYSSVVIKIERADQINEISGQLGMTPFIFSRLAFALISE